MFEKLHRLLVAELYAADEVDWSRAVADVVHLWAKKGPYIPGESTIAPKLIAGTSKLPRMRVGSDRGAFIVVMRQASICGRGGTKTCSRFGRWPGSGRGGGSGVGRVRPGEFTRRQHLGRVERRL